MPFGVTNAPSTFQRMMNSLFKEELDDFVLVYLDDILVFSSTLDQHISHIQKTLDRLRKAKLYARLHKCAFFQRRVEYLGYDVSADGIQPSASKVKAVIEWPRPQGVRDVRGFLGLASFYRRFIKHFSTKAKPLTDLTRENHVWQWTTVEENAFNSLKQSLVVAPVLHSPDFDLQFVVTTDASLVAVGAILEQDFGQGLQPVAYESRKLNPAETRYSAYERELLGIVWAIGKWRHYLEGKHFVVQTDHSSLRHLPNQPSVNRRIWKWVSILQGYDIEIRHIPGKVNPADALTRQVRGRDEIYAGEVKQQDADWVQGMRVSVDATDRDIQTKLKQLYSSSILQGTGDTVQNQLTIFSAVNVVQEKIDHRLLAISESSIEIDTETKVQWLQHLMNEDPYAGIVQQFNEDRQCREIIRQAKKYRMKQGRLCIHEDDQDQSQSYWRVIVPDQQAVKTKLLEEIHCVPFAGHPGMARTLEMVKRHFYWSHMTPEVRQFVLDCPVCQTEKGSSLKTGGKLMPLEIPERKWEHVVIDFVVGLPVQEGCDTIFTVVDKATKMCHFIPCSERISAKQVAYLYWSQVGKLHGIPKVLISDRDVRFTSKFWKSLWNILGTNIRMGSGFHPQSSGQVEIFNKLLEQTLRCTIHQLEETRNWVKVLPAIEFAVNNSANRTTGFSAFYLNYGYHPLHPVQIMHSPEESSVEAVTQFASRLQEDFTVATRHLQQARDQMIKQTEPHRRAVQFQEGDQVLLSTRNFRFKHCPTKMQRRYVGPFIIIERISAVAYRLRLPDSWSMHPVFHVSLLKPWRESAWSCPVEETEPELDAELEPAEIHEVENILKWRKVKVGRKASREFLVTWTGFPLDEAQWIPESDFPFPDELRQRLMDDQPVEDKTSSRSA